MVMAATESVTNLNWGMMFLLGLICFGLFMVTAVVLLLLAFRRSRRPWPASDVRHCLECGAVLPADAPHGLCPRCLLRSGVSDTPTGIRPLPQTTPHHPPSEGHTPDRPAAASTGGENLSAPTPAELAGHFPHLEILELLGQGGMGAVY